MYFTQQNVATPTEDILSSLGRIVVLRGHTCFPSAILYLSIPSVGGHCGGGGVMGVIMRAGVDNM